MSDIENEENESEGTYEIILEAYYDNIKEDKDLLIGFNPDAVAMNRIELKVNLIYFDTHLTRSNDSYNYYKEFKVNVVGGFYASDEIDTLEKYLDAIKDLNEPPTYIVVTYPKNFSEVHKICENYLFIEEIIIITQFVEKHKHLKSQKNKLLKHISKNHDDLIFLKNYYIIEIRFGYSDSAFIPIYQFFKFCSFLKDRARFSSYSQRIINIKYSNFSL